MSYYERMKEDEEEPGALVRLCLRVLSTPAERHRQEQTLDIWIRGRDSGREGISCVFLSVTYIREYVQNHAEGFKVHLKYEETTSSRLFEKSLNVFSTLGIVGVKCI